MVDNGYKISELEKSIGELYYCILHSCNIEAAEILNSMQDNMKIEVEELKDQYEESKKKAIEAIYFK